MTPIDVSNFVLQTERTYHPGQARMHPVFNRIEGAAAFYVSFPYNGRPDAVIVRVLSADAGPASLTPDETLVRVSFSVDGGAVRRFQLVTDAPPEAAAAHELIYELCIDVAGGYQWK